MVTLVELAEVVLSEQRRKMPAKGKRALIDVPYSCGLLLFFVQLDYALERGVNFIDTAEL